jgi:hypothetical protein
MSWSDVHNSQAAHNVRLIRSSRRADSGDLAATVTITSRAPLAVRVHALPTVREILDGAASPGHLRLDLVT